MLGGDITPAFDAFVPPQHVRTQGKDEGDDLGPAVAKHLVPGATQPRADVRPGWVDDGARRPWETKTVLAALQRVVARRQVSLVAGCRIELPTRDPSASGN